MAKKILAIKTREGKLPINGQKLKDKLIEIGFTFTGTRDKEVESVGIIDYYLSGPFYYLFLEQEEGRQWSLYPGNSWTCKDGFTIDSEIYDSRIKTIDTLDESDITFLKQ